jgi:hypothetical protein
MNKVQVLTSLSHMGFVPTSDYDQIRFGLACAGNSLPARLYLQKEQWRVAVGNNTVVVYAMLPEPHTKGRIAFSEFTQDKLTTIINGGE